MRSVQNIAIHSSDARILEVMRWELFTLPIDNDFLHALVLMLTQGVAVMRSTLLGTVALLAVCLVTCCAAPYPQSSRNFVAGDVARERARADFSAARRDEAYGNYGRAAYDREAGSVARSRAESDVAAGSRDRAMGW